MSPWGGVDHLLLLLLHLVGAQLEPPEEGNVGCLFSELLCTENEVCFNDLVIGRCVSASSHNQQVARLGPLEGPPLGLLEAEMARVFGLGFSWPDIYTQCVFQSLLYDIQNRQPYSKQQCAHLLTAQRLMSEEGEDLGDTEGEEDGEEEGDAIDREDLIYQPEDFQNGYLPSDEQSYDLDEGENRQALIIPAGGLDLNEMGTEETDDDEEDESHMPNAVWDTDNADAPQLLYVPDLDEDDDQELSKEDQERTWLELQQVLSNPPSVVEPNNLAYSLGSEGNDEDQDSGLEEQIILVSPDDLYKSKRIPVQYSSNFLPQEEDLSDLSSYLVFPDNVPQAYEDAVFIPVQQSNYQPLPDYQQQNEDYHPVEKREASYFSPQEEDVLPWEPLSPAYGYVISPQNVDYVIAPEDAGYLVPDLYENSYNTQPEIYEPLGEVPLADLDDSDEEDGFVQPLDEPIWDPDDDARQARTNQRERRNDPTTLMDELYVDDAERDISNYDFDYEDSAATKDDDDDVLYYNPDNEPIPVESVFDRRERLDVKKPGPFFTNSPNNFFLDKLLPEDSEAGTELDDDPGQTEYEFPLSPPGARQKKDLQESILTYSDPIEQGNDYLYINIKDRFSSLGQANRLAQYVADHLELPREVFSDFRPETSRILLKVNSNPRRLNATSMAKLLESDTKLREHAKDDLGLEIDSFGAGDEDSVVSVYSGPSRLFLLLFLLTAGLASLLVVAAVLLLLRRRARLNTKIQEAKQVKEEPVKEYKQLVRDWSRSSRASQGSSTNGENGSTGTVTHSQPQPAQPKGAVASPNKILQKSSQNSEGSRTSSTSSWQEEPGVSTMDISTGHMVLSYMEDHLKNKQRLEQEWVGLCAYEAEPNSTSIAFKVENKKKNRYPDKLPYDHNRVLLNALVNGSNSDYINASTVMDHDPRNPAYIITQGPMTHTVADFWQMVWEQGSVVIVMLSRLAENGYQLAQRYWPEEGSEQYHIFEVHLVSEHVWCDDYLVRSLYLKNSQTGETRTVTQFHFLSWPDSNIPTSTKAILEFRRKVNKSYRGRSCPMIVHCSDGVGRSGTYVLIDMVLNRMMKGSKEIDIAATLEHIRDQRSGMVQTRSQFEFCLMAVAEETHAILKALPQ